ncbi:hypothetical protein GCM10017764_17640 [Sphingobacterium griseoflavum]|uniref:Uncharacterized protein n=1 Tax=Sphingobacterium griseoflavum TaxID=1474952 RepID=A0ABQ3HWJ2_9SPHI|nr:hypothetical protein GCM10017764_17640 [Sphingobacterium griseoflavum]
MPWCEYLIKSKAWQRMETDKYRHTRFIAFHALIGSHMDGKRLPKSLDQFMPLDGKKEIKKASDHLRSIYTEEYKEYLEKSKK